MRVYIAGPITGTTDWRQRFYDAEQRLTHQGHEPMNPAMLGDPARTWEWNMRRAVMMLLHSEGVALLPGYKESRGARIERQLACDLGMHVHELDWPGAAA